MFCVFSGYKHYFPPKNSTDLETQTSQLITTMEDFRPRQFVNGATIRSFVNKPVSVFVKVDSIESSGKTVRGQTTDQRSISVVLSEPVNNSVNGQWIEADGVAISQDTVKCEKVGGGFLWVSGRLQQQRFIPSRPLPLTLKRATRSPLTRTLTTCSCTS